MNPVLDLAIRATALMVIGLLGWRLIRRHSAESRCAVLRATFIGLAALPLAAWVGPKWEPVVPFVAKPEPIVIDAELLAAVQGAMPETPASIPWVGIAWGVLALAVFLPALIGWRSLRKLWSRATTPGTTLGEELAAALRGLGVRSTVDVRLGETKTPLVFGCLRPHVLLPRDFGDWPESHRRSALLHEAAHIRRFDCAWLALAAAVRAVYACHPLVWWLSGALKDETELAADERAIQSGVEATDYASALVAIARDLQRPGRLVHSQGVTFMNHRQLDRRVRGALATRRRGFTLIGALGLMSSALAAVFGIAAIHPHMPAQDILVAPSAEEQPALIDLQAQPDDLYAPIKPAVAAAQAKSKAPQKTKASAKTKVKAAKAPKNGVVQLHYTIKPSAGRGVYELKFAPKVSTTWALPAKAPRVSTTWAYPARAGAPTAYTTYTAKPGQAAAAPVISYAPIPYSNLNTTAVTAPRALPGSGDASPIQAQAPEKAADDAKRAREIVQKLLENAKGKPEEDDLKKLLELLTKSKSHSMVHEVMGSLYNMEALRAKEVQGVHLNQEHLAKLMEERSVVGQRAHADAIKLTHDHLLRARQELELAKAPRVVRGEALAKAGVALEAARQAQAEGIWVRGHELAKGVKLDPLHMQAMERAMITRVGSEKNGVIEIVITDEKGKRQVLKVRPDQVKKTIKLQRGKDGKIRVIDK